MFGLLSNRHADRTSRSPCGRFVFRSRTWPPTRRPAVARTHQGQTFGAVIDGQTSAASCHRRVDGFLWGALVPFSNCVSLVQYISYNWRTIYILLQSIYMTIYTIIIWSNLCHTFRTSDPSPSFEGRHREGQDVPNQDRLGVDTPRVGRRYRTSFCSARKGPLPALPDFK